MRLLPVGLQAFPVASTSPLRRILTAVNVARDPVPAIQVAEKPRLPGRSWGVRNGRISILPLGSNPITF